MHENYTKLIVFIDQLHRHGQRPGCKLEPRGEDSRENIHNMRLLEVKVRPSNYNGGSLNPLAIAHLFIKV